MPPVLTVEEITSRLESFELDKNMITIGAYSPQAAHLPNSHLPFVEVHLAYLRSHKNVNPSHYLSNLSIMLRKR